MAARWSQRKENTDMAYATTNPPTLLVPSIGNKPALWAYSSTDPSTDVVTAGYFSNGQSLGLKLDDFMLATLASSNAMLLGKVTAVSSTGATVTSGNLQSTL